MLNSLLEIYDPDSQVYLYLLGALLGDWLLGQLIAVHDPKISEIRNDQKQELSEV